MASAPPGGPSESCRSGTRPLSLSILHPSWPSQAAHSRVPQRHPESKKEAAQEKAAVKPSKCRNGRYLCHSRCAWSSPLTPLGKQPPQAQQLPDGWGPLWPPSFLLPDNTRDTKWWRQIRQHPSRQAPRGSIWLGPRLPHQGGLAPCSGGPEGRGGRALIPTRHRLPCGSFHLLTLPPGDKVLEAQQQGLDKKPFSPPTR